MGMLDQIVPFSEHFKDGEVFTLEGAKVGPAINTDYGDSRPAQLKIGGKWYSIFGVALVNQIERMDDEDRRAMRSNSMRVKVCRGTTRKGQEVKLIVPEDANCDDSGKLTDDIPF